MNIPGGQGVQVGDRNVQVNVWREARAPSGGGGRRGGRTGPLRVFLSHTGELSRFPADGSFVAAAKRAVERAGHAVVEMDTWTATDLPTSAKDAEELAGCDVYVGILGFRYGSTVREDTSRSYTEHEFDTAGEFGLPRLVFLLAEDPEVPLPREVLFEPNHDLSDRQEAFRAQVDEAGLVRHLVRSPKDLETALYQSLIEHADRIAREQPVPSPPGESAEARGPVFAVPPPEPGDVPRPDLARELLRLLDPPVDAPAIPEVGAKGGSVVGMATGLAGAGGFGKTTLARMLVHDPAVRERFCDGIVWVTLGDQLAGPDLADRIDDACAALTGVKPPHADPILAGAALGEALGQRRVLLVLDDAWSKAQVQPFLSGGVNTVRLVTTRQPSVLSDGAVRVPVDAMTGDEATDLLAHGLPGLPRPLVSEVQELTGRWPLLLGLVNGMARADVQAGLTPAQAVAEIRDQLATAGVTALDVADLGDRNRAASTTIELSLNRLTEDERDRYRQLAVFGGDVDIPLAVLNRYWGTADEPVMISV